MKNKLFLFFDHFEEIIASILMGIVFICFGLSIFLRFFGASASFFTEIIQYSFLIALLFGVSYASKTNSHIRADIVTSKLNDKWKKIFALVGDMFTISFSLGLVIFGLRIVKNMIVYPQKLPILQIPYWIIYLMLPISAVLTIIRVLQFRINEIKKEKQEVVKI